MSRHIFSFFSFQCYVHISNSNDVGSDANMLPCRLWVNIHAVLFFGEINLSLHNAEIWEQESWHQLYDML